MSLMQGLQGVHIIESIIQLLADSLEFQLLSVQFVCTSKGRERAGGGKVQNCADHERESGGKKERNQIRDQESGNQV